MPPLHKGALAIALLPTIVVSFLAQAYIGSDAVARGPAAAANEALEGDWKATVTGHGCAADRPAEPRTESIGDPPPSFLAP